ncbi:hypothetical protein MUK42_26359 [Musa troglodytarum]|uniref:Uncharacterized protein n=1 Tax=Musa troglodytarum TaxID=320322 RepID=A0A9E7HKI5_9LILI|nr:hypothetical protein MUK42_26359 [Musa troglodytarum]
MHTNEVPDLCSKRGLPPFMADSSDELCRSDDEAIRIQGGNKMGEQPIQAQLPRNNQAPLRSPSPAIVALRYDREELDQIGGTKDIGAGKPGWEQIGGAASFVGEGHLTAVQMLQKRCPRPHLLFLLCVRDTSALTGGGRSLMTWSLTSSPISGMLISEICESVSFLEKLHWDLNLLPATVWAPPLPIPAT